MLAARLLAHFGSLKTLAKVSTVELRSFMTIRQAERLVAALAVSARYKLRMLIKNLSRVRKPFIDPASICKPSNRKCCALFYSTLVCDGSPLSMSPKAHSMNHSAILGKFFGRLSSIRPTLWPLCTITHRDPSPSEADSRFTRRLLECSRILQIQMLDHVIVGASAPGRSGYFSFKEAGLIG